MLEAITVVLLVFHLFLLVQWKYVIRHKWFVSGFAGLVLIVAIYGIGGNRRLIVPLLVIWSLISVCLACYRGPTSADQVAEEIKTMLEQGKAEDTDQSER